jgi:hypothetical protein
MQIPFLAAVATTSFLTLASHAAPFGEPSSWIPTAGPVADTPFGREVYAVAVFDDGQGNGPALYAGGRFNTVGSVPMSHVARLGGSSWSPVGAGLAFHVRALTTFDDGSGEALYAAGFRDVMRWDGVAWSSIGSDVHAFGDGTVYAFSVFDDGNGDALYAGGSFTTSNGVSTPGVAKWDGVNWSPLGVGLNGTVHALTVFDDGTGAALYVGGTFNAAGGMPAPRIAKWDGTSWSALGTGVNDDVFSLTVFDDGTGSALYVGGAFVVAGGVSASRLAHWDGTSWFGGAGTGVNGNVFALSVFDDGGGPELYVGGAFTSTGGGPARSIARWDGTNWSPLASRPGGVAAPIRAFATFDDGAGPGLYATGWRGGGGRGFVTQWRSGDWSSPTPGLDGPVEAAVRFDNGSGPAQCIVGGFTFAGGQRMNRVGLWDGSTWSPLGDGFDDDSFQSTTGLIRSAEVFEGDLYVGGDFTRAAGAVATGIARWDGSTWSEVGTGLNGAAHTLLTFDDGSGPALYAGGTFSIAGDVFGVLFVARWDGTAWSAVGTGPGASAVYAFASFDSGSGSELYAGGHYQAGAFASRISRWDGSAWSDVGGAVGGDVLALAVYDSGGGPMLYAGTSTVIRWSGSAWTVTGFDTSGIVGALEVFNDGTGDALFAYGQFTERFTTRRGVHRFDGTTWSLIGNVDDDVSLLASLEDPLRGGPALLVGGDFTDVGGSNDAFLSRWGRSIATPSTFCSGDGTGSACPCGNIGAPGRGCNIPAGTGGIEMTVLNWAPDFAGGGLVDFVGVGFPPMAQAAAHLIRSTSPQAPATVFGDGLLCVSPTGLVRLNATLSSGGTSLTPTMHGAGAGTFYYQVWVRSFPITFCDPAAAYNLSNGVELTWP